MGLQCANGSPCSDAPAAVSGFQTSRSKYGSSKRGKYPDVILPMCVIPRMDAVLEPTKKKVLETKKMLDDARITEQRLDKSSFRRRLDDRELLEAVAGEMRTGAFAPAQLYQKR